METATGEQLEYLSNDEELRRFCVIYGTMQSNMMYRILSANDKPGMFEQLREEVEAVIVKSQRGAQKCNVGQVYDEVLNKCVPE